MGARCGGVAFVRRHASGEKWSVGGVGRVHGGLLNGVRVGEVEICPAKSGRYCGQLREPTVLTDRVWADVA